VIKPQLSEGLVDLRHRPPYPRKPKKYPLKRSRVTIAAGFRCQDALILCADSELNIGDALKTSKNLKLSGYKDVSTAAIMSGAGDWEYLRMAMELVKENLRTKDSYSFKHALKTSLIEIYENQIAALPPDNDIGFQLLSVAREEDGSLHLFKSSQTAVSEGDDYEFIGTGEPLGNYLAETLCDPLASIRQATIVAAYILRCIKKFVPRCGGRSDIFVLQSDGVMALARSSDIADWDQCFSAFDETTKSTFLSLTESPSVREIEETKERMAGLLGKCSKVLRFDELEGNF